MITKSGRNLGNHVLSGNSKDGFELKCIQCEKIWFSTNINKTCSKECTSEAKRKRMKENNPLNNPEIRKKQKLANGSPECREKKRIYALENNPMKDPEVREKHRLKMGTMTGKNNPLYTNSFALENLRKAENSPECRKKKSINTKKSYINGTHPMCFEENKIKVSLSNSKQFEEIKTFRDYNSLVWQITNRNLISHKNEIEDYDLREKNGIMN